MDRWAAETILMAAISWKQWRKHLNRQIITSTHSSDLLRDEGIGLDEVLLLQPGENGTSVRPAKDFDEIHQLLNGGLSLAEAVLPMTRPQNAEQLSLFGQYVLQNCGERS